MGLSKQLASFLGKVFKFFSADQAIDIDKEIGATVVESSPKNFGEKSVWIVVKTTEIKHVLHNLKVKHIEKCSWEKALLSDDNIFVTGPINGWVLLVGSRILTPDYNNGIKNVNNYLDELSKVFGESQYFVCQRTTDTAIWSKSINGKIERTYAIGDNFFYEEGYITALESEMCLIPDNPFLPENEDLFNQYLYPEISHVLKIAENWSFNPSKMTEIKDIPGFGYIIKLKN